MLPILKASACENTDKDWQAARRVELYHRCMDPIIEEINTLCSADNHFRFADKLVRKGRCFWHLLSMDGLEIAASTMCSTRDCPVCECPKDQLDQTDTVYPLRTTAEVKTRVETAQSRYLDRNGQIKQGNIGHVSMNS